MRKIAVGLSLGFVLLVSLSIASEKETAAVSQSEQWLSIVDEGKYGESWKQASDYFQKAMPQQQWEQALQGVRKPLGAVLSRKVQSTNYKTSMPGAPDGEYVVILFDTSFANKKSAVETVVSMLEKDGKWRVSGYFIK